jgi:HEAT repeat protein
MQVKGDFVKIKSRAILFKKIILLIGFSIFLSSCSSYSKAYRKWEENVNLQKNINTHDTETLIKELKDKSWWVRQLAAGALKNRGEQAVVPLIVAATRDSNPNVREAAISSLTDIFIFNQSGDLNILEVIVGALKDKNITVSLTVANCLGYIKNSKAIDTLIGVLKDKRKDGSGNSIRDYAAKSLVRIGNMSVGPLIEVLNDSSTEVKYSAIEALGEIKDTKATEPLIALLRDENLSVAVIRSLGKIKDVNSVEPLIALLNDTKDKSGKNKWGLSFEGETGVATVVTNPDISEEIKKALIGIGNPAVDFLIAALKDKNSKVRYDIAYILGKIKSPSSVEPLIKILDDETDNDTRKSAVWILEQLSGQDFGYSTAQWQEWWAKSKDKFDREE